MLHPKERGCRHRPPRSQAAVHPERRAVLEPSWVSILCPFLARVGQPWSQSWAARRPDSKASEARAAPAASSQMALGGSFCRQCLAANGFEWGKVFTFPWDCCFVSSELRKSSAPPLSSEIRLSLFFAFSVKANYMFILLLPVLLFLSVSV